MMDRISLVRKLIMIRRNPKETSLKEGAILTKYALTVHACCFIEVFFYYQIPSINISGVVPFQLKEEIELRKQMNISELNDLDEDTRVEIEGFRTGTYVRLEVHGVPFELVEHFDPCHPILVGGIGLAEENTGYMQVSQFFYSPVFVISTLRN
jgi:hypothetical protein